MKKYYLLLALFVGLCSCSDEQIIEKFPHAESLESQIPLLKSAGVPSFDLLGYGYDITEEYLKREASRYAVIDVKKFMNTGNNASRVDSIETTESDTKFYYGSDAYDYIKEITNTTLLNSTNNNTKNLELFNKKLVGFTATFNSEKEYHSKYTYSSKYSFAQSEKIIKIKTYKINSYPDTLSKYLTENFKKDLQIRTPQQIVDTYGTHVLLDFTIGGRLYSTFTSSYVEDSSYEKKRTYVKAGLNAALSKLSLDIDKTVDRTVAITQNNKNLVQNLRVRTVGGNSAIDIVYDMVNQNPQPLSTKDWENSVYANKGKNAALTDINWQKTYPIYEFISDPTKKAQVKDAVEKYITSKQIEVMELVPLYQYPAGPYNKDFYYDTRYNPEGRTTQGIVCYVHPASNPGAGTVPLYQYPNGMGGFYYDTRYNPDGRTTHGIVCYVYPASKPGVGTIPLYQYPSYSAFYYDIRYNPEGRKTQGITCYVYQ